MARLRFSTTLAMLALLSLAMVSTVSAQSSDEPIVQAQKVLTVSEGKRLIAKAIVRMPIVQEALKSGMVIVAKGTTTTYVVEELLGTDFPHGPYVLGRVYPEKGGKRLESHESITEVVLIDGKRQDDLPLSHAVRKLKAGDVVIKGANALNYQKRLAAGMIGVPNPRAGTARAGNGLREGGARRRT